MTKLARDLVLASIVLIYSAAEGTIDTVLIVSMLYMLYAEIKFENYNKSVDTNRQKG